MHGALLKTLSSPTTFVALLFASLGFFLIGIVGYVLSPEWLTADEIDDLAKVKVIEEECPPKPSGRVEEYQDLSKVCTDVPKISGFKVTIAQSCIDVPVIKTRPVDPTDAEITQWSRECEQINSRNFLTLKSERDKISADQKAALKSYLDDMIKISLGLIGVIGAFVGLIVSARTR